MIADPSAPVYFLLHLPKTAGQTMTAHLAAHARAGAYVEPTRRGAQGPVASPDRVGALSGHWLRRGMEQDFAGREIRRAVLLRDPLGVQVSLYNFRMMNYRAKGVGDYSFDLHLGAIPRNYLSHCLLTRWLELSPLAAARMSDAEQFDRIDAELARFWFVGSHRDSPTLVAAIAGDLGIPPVAAARNTEAEWRQQVTGPILRADTLPASTIARIGRDHAVDQALFDRWAPAHFGGAPMGPAPTLDPRAPGWDMVASRWANEARRLFARDASRIRFVGQGARVDAANAARRAQDWPLAATLFHRAIVRGTGTPSLWIEYARALREARRPAEAITAFDTALSLKPDMADIARERADLRTRAACESAASD